MQMWIMYNDTSSGSVACFENGQLFKVVKTLVTAEKLYMQ